MVRLLFGMANERAAPLAQQDVTAHVCRNAESQGMRRTMHMS